MMGHEAAQKRYATHIGKRFGALTFLGVSRKRGTNNRICGTLLCGCGKYIERPLSRIIQGKEPRHCGCQTDKGKSRTHGMKGSREYISWQAMKQRCLKSSAKDYPRYGERGVTICQEWIDSFSSFYKHIGDRPEGTTVDRIDGKRGYEPGNVRWATPTEQARNRFNTIIAETPLGTMFLVEYARKIGLTDGAAYMRLKRGKLDGCYRV